MLTHKIHMQISNPFILLNCCLYCDMCFINKYCDKSFINKSAFLNFVPQLIMKIHCTGTTRFYRFVCAIVAQAYISFMTRMTSTKLSMIIIQGLTWMVKQSISPDYLQNVLYWIQKVALPHFYSRVTDWWQYRVG